MTGLRDRGRESKAVEHWSVYGGNDGEWWVVGANMRIVAACKNRKDAERIIADHEIVRAGRQAASMHVERDVTGKPMRDPDDQMEYLGG